VRTQRLPEADRWIAAQPPVASAAPAAGRM